MENRAYKVIFQQDEREKISYVYSVILLAFTEINYMNDFILPLLFHRYHVLCYACSLIQVSNLLISVTHHFSVEKKKKNHIISSKLQTFFFFNCILPNLRPGRSFTFHGLIVQSSQRNYHSKFRKHFINDLNLSLMTSSKNHR